MIREIAITLYLSVFRFFFELFKLFPQTKKTIFISYFGDNVSHVVRELEKKTDEKIIIAKTKHCRVLFQKEKNKRIIDLSGVKIGQYLLFIYHLATAKTVMVDNYYGFLAVTNFKENVVCVQLWHAAGAIKKFGLKDLSVSNRSNRAIKRFHSVYQRFDKVVIGSEEMVPIYEKSFEITKEKFLRTGIPRTDFFFEEEKEKTKQMLYAQYPMLKEKKVILYAPTFRDDETADIDCTLNIEKMYEAFNEEYVLLLRLHPIIKNNWKNKYPEFAIDVSHYENVNHLLLISDVLISDYSSIPFEFSLLEKPMVFYAYDLENYQKTRGIWQEYEQMIPDSVMKTTDEVINKIKTKDFSKEAIVEFKNKWNKYSNGNASESLIKELCEE